MVKPMLERVLNWYTRAYGWTVVAFRLSVTLMPAEPLPTLGEDHRPETHLIPLLLHTAIGERDHFDIFGNDYSTPDGTCLWDYVHVLGRTHLLAFQLSQTPGTHSYNTGTGISYSVREVCRVVEQVVGKKIYVQETTRGIRPFYAQVPSGSRPISNGNLHLPIYVR
jgi:UDP-glucose 4-epimerase